VPLLVGGGHSRGRQPLLDMWAAFSTSYRQLSRQCKILADNIGRCLRLTVFVTIWQYVPDPLIKAFDLRTNRQLSPISMTVSTPSFVRFVPAFSSIEMNAVMASPGPIFIASSVNCLMLQLCLCVLAGGLLQLSRLAISQAGTCTLTDSQILQTAKIDRREAVTSVAVSTSGQVMCVGTNCGNVTCFVTQESMQYSTKPKINEVKHNSPMNFVC
jgi:hypothetical protein